MKLAIIALLLVAISATAAPDEPAFQLAPYATHDGETTAFGLQFKLKIGGILPSRKEIAGLFYGDELEPQHMVAQVGAEQTKALHKENQALIAQGAQPAAIPAGYDPRPWYQRITGLQWTGIAAAAALLATEATGNTDVFGRDNDSDREENTTVVPNGVAVTIEGSTGNNVIINSPTDN